MPEVAYRYPVPNRYYTDYQVRKYGAIMELATNMFLKKQLSY